MRPVRNGEKAYMACGKCADLFVSYADYQAHLPCSGPDTPPDEEEEEEWPWPIV